jgi:hypothetical protein
MDLTFYTFLTRIALSLICVGFGIAIYFINDDPSTKMGGFGLVTMILGLWMPSGKTYETPRVLVQSEV